MARYPGAIFKEVARFRTPIRGPVRVNLHTAVSATTSLFSFFNRSGNPCSHFYVRQDGTVEQYVDTRYRAAADLDGNPDTISIETWDGYPSRAPGYWRHNSDVPPWTPQQVASLTALLAWVVRTHPTIPARLATDSVPGPSSHGISWHRLGIDPWRRAGGLKYSNARGKVCPGDRRIAQIPGLLASAASDSAAIPTAPGGITPGNPPAPIAPKDWFDMATEADLERVVLKAMAARPNIAVVQAPGRPQVYITDFIVKQHIPDPTTLAEVMRKAGITEITPIGAFALDRIPNLITEIPTGVTTEDVATAVRDAVAALDVRIDADDAAALADDVAAQLAGRLKVDVTVRTD